MNTTIKAKTMPLATSTNKMTPMPLGTSFIYFGGGALLFFLIQRLLAPALADWGLNYAILFLVLQGSHMFFFFWALYAYRREGNPWTWQAFFSRFRIHKIKGKFWLWVILFVAVDIGLYLLVYAVGYPVVKWVHDLLPDPAIVTDVFGDASTFAGYPLAGNWWLLGLFFFTYFFNVLGEEFLWRGYIFPRQELTHGKRTWIVQKHKNTTIFIIAHATLNGLAVMRILAGILGS